MDIAPDEHERYTVRHGDLLVCEGGDVGRAAIWEADRVGYQKALHRLRPRKGAKTRFMYYILTAAKAAGAFEHDDIKATISHLPAEKFRQIRFAFPPQPEQEIIYAHLDCYIATVDNLVERVADSINRLKERRAALITAAVTGQIDVTTWGRTGAAERQLDALQSEITL